MLSCSHAAWYPYYAVVAKMPGNKRYGSVQSKAPVGCPSLPGLSAGGNAFGRIALAILRCWAASYAGPPLRRGQRRGERPLSHRLGHLLGLGSWWRAVKNGPRCPSRRQCASVSFGICRPLRGQENPEPHAHRFLRAPNRPPEFRVRCLPCVYGVSRHSPNAEYN